MSRGRTGPPSVLPAVVVARVVETFWSLGGQVEQLDAGRVVRHAAAPSHPLGNFLCRVRARSPEQVTDLLNHAVEGVGGAPLRVLVDPGTPPAVEAELVARDWVLEHQLQLVLPTGAVLTAPAADPPWQAVAVRTGPDWAAVAALFRLDHEEEDRRLRRPVRTREATSAAVSLRRALGDAVEYTVARQADRPIGCIAQWVGAERVGVIEDVFVHPDHRGRRVATALLQHAVQRARARGAGPVVIGAEPGDTPKRLYAGLGFRPAAVTRSWSAPA